MDIHETEEQETMIFSISLHFIYGFLTLLGICILFSLIKAIYHFYKKSNENGSIAEDSTSTECHSVSNASPASQRQVQNVVSESERLNLQLDKLRKLLNRLNAMGTFSRDTIGDLSEQSASNIIRSRQASSDMSEFWSSIDFDEFEDSAINEGNFQKTMTEKSISVSDFSLDTSGVHFNNFGRTNLRASSNMSVRKTLPNQNQPSEAIAQILIILDSIMQKNRPDTLSTEKNELPIEINTNKFLTAKHVSQSAHSVESSIPRKLLIHSSSSMSMDKTLSSSSASMCSDTLISVPETEKFDVLNSETEVVKTSKLNFLDQMSQTIDSKKISSAVSMEEKISKGMSVVNITGSKNLKRFSSSTKSVDARKISLSRSVAICIDPNGCQTTKATSESTVSPRKSYLKKNEKPEIISVTGIQRKHPCTLEILNRTHSLSNLLAKKLPLQSIQPCFIKSCNNVMEYEASKPESKASAQVTTKSSELYKDFRSVSSRNVEALGTKIVNSEILNNKSNSRTSRRLLSPIVTSGSKKLSISDSEVNRSAILGCFSPNLTPSNSEVFLSPFITENMSSGENIDWKSPVEPIMGVSLTQNFTPHSENAIHPTNSRIWCTPPSPK